MKPVQHKLERVRAPRVHISYEVTTGGAIERRELPLVIGVLGDFSGSSENRLRWRDRRFTTVDFDSFEEVLASWGPRARFRIPSSLEAAGLEIDLAFERLDDFEPQRIVERVEPLRRLQRSAAREERAKLQRHLDRVLHAPEFQALESAWRGLWYLLSHVESGPYIKVKIVDVTKAELLRDLQRAPESNQSSLFKKVYEEPYGSVEGEPFGLFIGDYAFGASGSDIELLEGLARIASNCLAPFIASASADMFDLESLARLDEPRDLSRVFDTTAHARWNAFRASEDARYVGLVVPRVLARTPYGIRPGTPAELQYDEDTRGKQYLVWSNPAYAFGACVANAFSRYGWCGAIRGIESGGLVEGLPMWEQDVGGQVKVRSVTEAQIQDRREKELSDLGFIPLVQAKGADYAVFFSTPSCAKGRVYDSDAATASSRLMCQLQYVLTASRFMHHLKSIALQHRDSCETRGEWERLLNGWIGRYVLTDDQASPAIRALSPLREARIDVVEVPGQPGQHRVVAFLRPHFQLDELPLSLRLVTNLI